MKRLSEVDQEGDSIFRSTHVFYRDALKPGPALDTLTLKFLGFLRDEFDKFDASQATSPGETSLHGRSRKMLGSASTNAMMGPSLLRDNPDLLSSVWIVETGFHLFVNKIPRMFARRQYEARDRINDAFTAYFSDEGKRQEGAPVIWDREVQMRNRGMTTRDVAAYTYSAYSVTSFFVHIILQLISFHLIGVCRHLQPRLIVF